MNKNGIMAKMTRTFHKGVFQLKKYSPEILVIGGIVGVGVSAVMACKATLKVNEVVEEAKTNIEKIHTASEKGVTEAGKTFTEEDKKKDLTLVYVQTGLKFAKLYGPALAVGGLSVAAILTSSNILRKRNLAIAAAYTAVDNSFKEYRGRVVERFGEALDKELRYNITAKEIEEVTVNEDGSESIVKKTVDVVNYSPNVYTEYARFFDNTCAGWDPNPDFSRMFLIQQQNWANDKLKSRGYLFFNEVLESLGMPVCAMGQTVGWIYDEKNPIGDNYVDFGIFDIYKEGSRDFVNGYENVILLDFNVDGNILKYI